MNPDDIIKFQHPTDQPKPLPRPISAAEAYSLRHNSGYLLPPEKRYATKRLKEIAIRMSALNAEFQALDREIVELAAKE